MQWLKIASLIMAMIVIVMAQNGSKPADIKATAGAPIIASPSQQAEMKPLIEAEKKAAEEFNAAIAKLPEKATFEAAKAAYEAAIVKAPANAAYNAAKERTLDKAFIFMAQNQLSARQYKPILDEKGNLAFERIPEKQ